MTISTGQARRVRSSMEICKKSERATQRWLNDGSPMRLEFAEDGAAEAHDSTLAPCGAFCFLCVKQKVALALQNRFCKSILPRLVRRPGSGGVNTASSSRLV